MKNKPKMHSSSDCPSSEIPMFRDLSFRILGFRFFSDFLIVGFSISSFLKGILGFSDSRNPSFLKLSDCRILGF